MLEEVDYSMGVDAPNQPHTCCPNMRLAGSHFQSGCPRRSIAAKPQTWTARVGQGTSMGAIGGLTNLCWALRFKASTRSRTLSGASPVRI